MDAGEQRGRVHELSLQNRRPDWFDERLFPFDSHWIDVAGARVHYVDEGSGPLLLMLHDQPTWSFLYRHLIERLRDEFRCVALDYPGFGLSTAPPDFGYRITEQVEVVEAFVEELALTDLTPLMQDWGGPIGMALAVRQPERIRAFVIANTWAWPTDRLGARLMSAVLGGPLGHLLVRRLDVFTRFIGKGMNKRELTEDELAMYRAPHPTPASREPLHLMPREITRTPVLAEIEAGIQRVADRPALITWGLRDVVFGEPELDRWRSTFEDHRLVLLEEAGHYVWEDEPDTVATAIRDWHPALG